MNKCLYIPGKFYIEGLIIDDKTQYSKIPVKEYMKSSPKVEIWDFDKAVDECQKVALEKFVTDWKEIDKEDFWEMLEVLPPENWKTFMGGEIFRMMEYDYGRITGHYARLGERYFKASKPCGDYKPMITELRNFDINQFKKYKKGEYTFTAPPVYTGSWSDQDWINYINKNGAWR